MNIDDRKIAQLRAVADHRETYSPGLNETRVLTSWERATAALKSAIKMLEAKSGKWTPHTIGAWAQSTFGKPTPAVAAARANEEMAELLIALAKGDMDKADIEAADVVIVLCHYASSRGIDLWQIVSEKMEVNVARQWKVAGGVGYHVKAPT